MYNPDKPIKRPEDDLLGRSEFTQQLAEAIKTLSTTDTFVVGLYGEWGSGKTSVINLTEKVIKQSLSEKDKQEIKIIRFNPWGYIDGSQLIGQFFSELSLELQYDRKSLFQASMGETIENYAFALEYAKYIPKIGLFLRPFLPAIKNLTEKAGKAIKDKATSKKYDVLYQKKCVEDKLAENKIKLIIFIDDLDRLPNDQIRMIFQLVNSVANFPNTIYILSFDYAIVCRALASEQNCKGAEYLEKIIQFPISLPKVNSEMVYAILDSELKKLFLGTKEDLIEKDHWNLVLSKCVLPFINSLRDVHRYINTLYFKYIPLKNNLNPSDFVGLIALEVFEHHIYVWIRNSKDTLTKHNEDDPLFSNNNRKLEKDNWCNEFKEKCISLPEVVLEAVSILFPMYASMYDMPYESLDEEKFSRFMRLCSAQRFDAYFTLDLGSTLLSFETRNLTYTKYNRQAINDYINEIIDNNLSREYLRETLSSIEMIPEDRILMFVEILFNKLSSFSKYDENVISYSGYFLSLLLISKLLLCIHDEQSRLSLFQSLIIEASEANVYASAQLIHNMEVALGRFGSTRSREDKIVFSLENIESIEQSFMSRINTLPDQSKILRSEHLIFIDYLWKNIDVQGYTEKMKFLLSNPKNLLLYTANKAQRFVPLFDGTISWTFDFARDFSPFPTVADVVEVIKSESFRFLIDDFSLALITKLAAFLLLTKDISKDTDKGITNSAAEELALSWLEKLIITE